MKVLVVKVYSVNDLLGCYENCAYQQYVIFIGKSESSNDRKINGPLVSRLTHKTGYQINIKNVCDNTARLVECVCLP